MKTSRAEKHLVFMFTGQGSQYFQMGLELYKNNSVFREVADSLDKQVHDLLGESVLAQVYCHGKSQGDCFDRLLYTHPAIFIIEYALARTLIEIGIEPAKTVGASLGEFAAASIAGILPPETALAAVVKQALLVEEKCLPGFMTAIFHHPSLYDEPLLHRHCELAAVNFASHFVVSGEPEAIINIEKALRVRDILYQRLPILYGFHSQLIEPAGVSYREYLSTQQFYENKIPFVSCLTGEIRRITEEHFWNISRKKIGFLDALTTLEQQGPNIYIDISPGSTLANFVKRGINTNSGSEIYPIMTAFQTDVSNFTKLVKSNYQARPTAPTTDRRRMLVWIFPGQGSQHVGMGGNLFDEFPDLTRKADEILGYSIQELCLNDYKNHLNDTRFTQPALFIVNALSYLHRRYNEKRQPDYVMGHSLGEYNALFAAGAFDFETGIRLVKKRGELMSEALGGSMAAVIRISPEKIRDIIANNNLTSISIANYNSPEQTVISGAQEDIASAASLFEAAGAMYIPLKVSGAFHSKHMLKASHEFKNFLESLPMADLNLPVISNLHARAYHPGELKNNLVQQIISPVLWTDSVKYLLGIAEIDFEEVGPGNVLTKLVQGIRKHTTR